MLLVLPHAKPPLRGIHDIIHFVEIQNKTYVCERHTIWSYMFAITICTVFCKNRNTESLDMYEKIPLVRHCET